LYPFSLSNTPAHRVAAAAGGCILIKKSLLDGIGAFGSLGNALIDDCALASIAKKAGGRTWIGLTHTAISLRPYRTLMNIWGMVARSAYTQLRYSSILLLLSTVLMAIMFLLPFAAILFLEPAEVVALFLMFLCYLPTLRYYGIHPLWGCLLPVTGILYLCMSWTSAWRHACMRGAIWKDRCYATTAGKDCNFR
ncbi:MAG: glycosyltransferase, partial [Gammaproteobacteria bacterium]